jgi:DNA polymerase-4
MDIGLMEELRQIIHVDMDAYYASIEQRDHPELRGMPVVVGGDRYGRGVVTTCSYEARKYGIHSAMPSKIAYQRCPHAIFIKPRFNLYQEISEQIMEIFHRFSEHVQPLSLDEAYLDVSAISKNFTTSKLLALQIKNEIKKQTGLTASVGVSFNKFLAKVASDFNKPNGITVITLDNADEFIDNLPIGKFYGIGKVTEKKMLKLGIKTGADLKEFGPEKLKKYFGIAGEYYYNCAIGIDNRPVMIHWTRKSLGHERTLYSDIDNIDEMLKILENLAQRIEEYLKEHGLQGRTITLKMRYQNYQRITRGVTLSEPIDDAKIIMLNIKKLLGKTKAGERKVRLLGIAISNFVRYNDNTKYKQSILKL